ncbi:DeoR/GlpR family DNA-binding transcription regulator [Arthrobacter sp. Br18]|uniref:DeoR/GlpR family DNA-binding transcription regulator n=1 Tax=Arthrobacter sp. Br18 TaxID=1312954 RepID=UPI0004B13F82|nr:DeoR/GlpR family DNA-binding transcription regulator [Arthrobacter sp. Br18]
MLAAERHAAILGALRTRPAVRVSDLSVRFGVSEMTVRRDIDVLVAAGSLHRVHGGATRRLSALEAGFSVNSGRQATAKRAIAAAAAALVLPGMTVAVTGGTTTFELARHLVLVDDLTVITNSLPLAEELHRLRPPPDAAGSAPRQQVLLTGGERSPSEALVGPLAITAIRALHADLCFMGAHGVDAAAGISTPNLAEASTNQSFAGQCGSLLILADTTKFGVISLARVVGLDAVAGVVTDSPPADPRYAALADLTVASTQPSDQPSDQTIKKATP